MSTSELSAVSHYVNRKLFEWLYNSVSILKTIELYTEIQVNCMIYIVQQSCFKKADYL